MQFDMEKYFFNANFNPRFKDSFVAKNIVFLNNRNTQFSRKEIY